MAVAVSSERGYKYENLRIEMLLRKMIYLIVHLSLSSTLSLPLSHIIRLSLSHCAKVQKYEQGKIGLQFFDMWC